MGSDEISREVTSRWGGVRVVGWMIDGGKEEKGKGL